VMSGHRPISKRIFQRSEPAGVVLDKQTGSQMSWRDRLRG
jgi:hypothetical protein